MTDADDDARVWAGLLRRYPEAGVAGVILFVVLGLGVNFAWWLVALPDLIDAHSNSRLFAAFFGSLFTLLGDAVIIVRALRWAGRLDSTRRTGEIGYGDDT